MSENQESHGEATSKTAAPVSGTEGDLIDNLLAFDRFGQAESHKTEVSLDELLRDVLGGFLGETKGRNVIWEIHPLFPLSWDAFFCQPLCVAAPNSPSLPGRGFWHKIFEI